jgi:hypothetical protein
VVLKAGVGEAGGMISAARELVAEDATSAEGDEELAELRD